MEEQTNNEVASELVESRGPGRPKGSGNKAVDKSSFLRAGGHEYDKIIKKTKNEIEAVMDALASIVTSDDATNSEKIKAGDILLTNYTRMVEQRNKDEITRKIAEIRVRNSAGNGSTDPEEEEEEDTPLIDFENINPDFVDVNPTPKQEKVDKEE